MEYIDMPSLGEMVEKTGPLDVLRTCHYIRQVASGLQHIHEAGLIHRDIIKPSDLLVDRIGNVKMINLGAAGSALDEWYTPYTAYHENGGSGVNYLAPEQAIEGHLVDIRANIYGLGGIFYFCLTGRTPFTEGTVAQILIWHQTRQPEPLQKIRSEVPDGVVAIIEKMMAKDPAQRYRTPQEVVEALKPWTRFSLQ